MKKYIKGNYRKTIFKSDQGYTIGLFKVRDTNDDFMKDHINKTITFTGYFHELNEDDIYHFYGEGIDSPKYGFQFQVSSYEKVKPEDKEGVVEFLSSDLFPGIGEKLALDIVNHLGIDALNEIIKNPNSLNLVPKLNQKKAKLIYDVLTKYEESHATIVFLTELGFNMKNALAIYNLYKQNTILNIEHNIYKIIDELPDISFIKIDQIALKKGVDELDVSRIKACIIYVLKNENFETGDTYIDFDTLLLKLESYLKLKLDENTLNNYIEELVLENKIVIKNSKYYLKEMYDAEENIANFIVKSIIKKDIKYHKIKENIKFLEEASKILYNDKQKEAITSALTKNILLITGGPGTGKTTIIKAIVESYMNLNELTHEQLLENVKLLAPTGRASKRISEATHFPSSTIHRFLKWNKENNEFGINEYNKDYSKLVIIDEVSMIDINLLNSLINGLTYQAQIILVGDHHQLPSVGPGQILKDLIECNIIPRVKLDLLYRQNDNSFIPILAKQIKDNDLNEEAFNPKDDYTFLNCHSSKIKESIKNIVQKMIEKNYDYKKLQIMAPTYMGINGIDIINKELQEVFNPPMADKEEIKYGDVVFRENDKVLQLVNLPDENIYNGDIGVIKHIIPARISQSKKLEIIIDFDSNEVKFYQKDLAMIKHGFVISIHKSQGSEFEAVIIPLCKSYGRMLYRRLIYTGITRAKKKLILLGSEEAFKYAVLTEESPRKTTLKEKINSLV